MKTGLTGSSKPDFHFQFLRFIHFFCFSTKTKDHRKSFESWLQSKHEQRLLFICRERELEKLKQLEVAENEKLRKSNQIKQENERRLKQVKDDTEKRNRKTNIYEDYLSLPSYGKSLISQLINEIALNDNVYG